MMTNNRSVLLISAIALILLALVPAASANTIIYDEELFEFIDTSKSDVKPPKTSGGSSDTKEGGDLIGFKDITQAQLLDFLVYEFSSKDFPSDVGEWLDGTKIEEGRHDFTYHFNGKDRPGVLYLNRKTDSSGKITSTQFTISLKDWDIGNLIGTQYVQVPFRFVDAGKGPTTGALYAETTNTFPCREDIYGEYRPVYRGQIKITEKTAIMWKHHLRVTEDTNYYHIDINGFIDGHKYTSEVAFKKGAEIYSKFTNPGEAIHRSVVKTEIDHIEITSPSGASYVYPLSGDVPHYPLRIVTVTMTDIDGNTIRGFEVRAVNAVTGKEYTVSTDSDVAYITLPMDQIASVPNPETGEYEAAPVGYYNFYGIKSGYKMVPDYAIRVNVLPEKYMPDVFCDIIVAPVGSVPDGHHVTVYVRNSQTGNLIAGSHVIISASVGGEFYEVVNQTLLGGIATYTLQPTGGGLPNPDYYRLIVTAAGYNPYMPYIDFELDRSTSLIVMMEPITGGPVDENKTFIEFYVRDLSGNGISDARVTCGGYTLFTNSVGYTQFEMPKNAIYPYTVSKSGYVSIEGQVTVGDGPRYTVNVVLGPKDIPTQPPVTDPGLPTPPPTTQPTSGIPDDDDGSEGFLIEAVRGISKLFGVGFSTAKMILGMLLALSIGFATAKHLRGGAAEFGIGLLGGTMLGILIGLLPVWTIVVLLLVVGLYIGHRYVGGGNNG